MGWARIDDGFHDHPKVDDLSLAAVGLWTLCLSHAHRHRKTALVKGHVAHARVRKLAGKQADGLTDELVRSGLWEPETGIGGWVFHDFDEYLPKERDPEERREAGRKGAAKRWQDDGNLPSTDMATDMASDSSRASAPAFPTRPVPEEQDIAPKDTARRDEIFEAIAEVCGIKPSEITKQGRGPMNAATADLRKVDATVNQIKIRANRYRQRYPNTSLTPSALTKHWASLNGSEPTAHGNRPSYEA